MNFAHVGRDASGNLVMDVGAERAFPIAELRAFLTSVEARVRVAEAQGAETITVDVVTRLPMSPDFARALASDLCDYADDQDRLDLAAQHADSTREESLLATHEEGFA